MACSLEGKQKKEFNLDVNEEGTREMIRLHKIMKLMDEGGNFHACLFFNVFIIFGVGWTAGT